MRDLRTKKKIHKKIHQTQPPEIKTKSRQSRKEVFQMKGAVVKLSPHLAGQWQCQRS